MVSEKVKGFHMAHLLEGKMESLNWAFSNGEVGYADEAYTSVRAMCQMFNLAYEAHIEVEFTKNWEEPFKLTEDPYDIVKKHYGEDD